MVVPINDALDTNLAVAYALVSAWSNNFADEVHTALGKWRNCDYQPSNASEHLDEIKKRLGPILSPKAAIALDGATIAGRTVLEEIFDAVAAKVYRLYGASVDTAINFAVSTINDAPYPYDSVRKCAFGAVAAFSPEFAGHGPTVKMTIQPGLLGPRTLASVPYVLCHELVCHAFQGAEHRNDDAFGEGWMDWAALLLHNYWSASLFPWQDQLAREEADKLSSMLRDAPDALRQNKPALADMREDRYRGWCAAERIQQRLLRFEKGTHPTLFEKLSVDMNVVDFSVDHRRAFISAVNATRNDEHLDRLLTTCLRAWVEELADAHDVLTFHSSGR